MVSFRVFFVKKRKHFGVISLILPSFKKEKKLLQKMPFILSEGVEASLVLEG